MKQPYLVPSHDYRGRFKIHQISYHFRAKRHFPLDLGQMGEMPVIFEERGHMPPMEKPECQACRKR